MQNINTFVTLLNASSNNTA